MAPEQAMGSELSPATDIYAVGTVLYELLSGNLPFPEDSNPVAMLYRHVHEDPKPLLEVASHVPTKLADVTQQSLARDPADRYHDAEVFAVALAEAAVETWGPGWLPASGMTVSTSGPVLSAATGQTARPVDETLAPRHDTPRETPVAQAMASPELVAVSSLLPNLAPSAPTPNTPAVDAALASETQAVAQVPPPPPSSQPPAQTPPPASPGGPPAQAPARRRRPWLIAISVAAVLVIALIVALLASGGPDKKTVKTSAAGALDPGQWAPVANAPTPRQELASAVDNGVMWTLGGLNGSQSTAKVEGYDPGANAWRPGPDLPLPLHHEMAATFKGDIIAAGGWVPENGVLNAKTSDQVFALRGGKWVGLPKLKHPRAAGAAAVAGDKLVLFGGQADGKLVHQTEVWDGSSWSDGPDLPTPRDHLAAASDGTYVYAVGGRELSADKNLGAFERYDPSAKKWSKLPAMPTPRGDLGAAVVGGRLVTVGGESSTAVFPIVESFDINKRKWSGLPPMRTPRHGLAVATVGNNVFAIDGAQVPSHGVSTNIAEVLPFTAAGPATSAAAASGSSPWKTVREAPTALQEVGSTVQGSVVWVVGGLNSGVAPSNEVAGYDTTLDSWTKGPPLPAAVHGAMATTYGGEVVVLGGWTMQGGGGASNQVFALRNGAWVPLPPMPTPRAAGGAAVVGDRLVVVGGQANGRPVAETDVFDGTTWTQGPPIPTPRDYVGVASVDTFVYAVGGGQVGGGDVAVFERFDLSTGKWTKGPPLPSARHGLGAAVVDGKLYVVGGERDESDVLGTVESFDLATGSSWNPGPSMRTPRHALAVQAVGSAIYAIEGGSATGGSHPTKINEVLRP
jgi:non-specific serine/threonine protein kinase